MKILDKEIDYLVKNNIFFPDNYNIIREVYSSRTGDTVAHIQAMYGWTTDNIRTLKLKNRSGWTVAHVLAKMGRLSARVKRNRTILNLKDREGVTVESLINKKK